MNFLQPWILWTLPLIALPVVIHLIHKRRHKVVEWGAMMFLLDGAKLSRGRQRLREILLLIMRTLAVLGLLFGVGRPIAGGWVGRIGGDAIDTVVLIVDRSPSMATHVEGRPESKLQSGMRGIRKALEVAGFEDLVVVDAVRPDLVRRVGGLSQLDELPLSEATSAPSDMAAAFETAVTYLEESESGRSEIWVVSDAQGADWRPEDGRWGALSKAMTELPAGIRVRLTLNPDLRPENLGVRVERVRRVSDRGGAELVIDAVITRTEASEGVGDTAVQVPLAIQVGGARSSVEVEMIGREARLQGHRIPVDSDLEKGFGFVELSADGRPSDDRFWFVFGDDPTLETLVVAETDDIARIGSIAAELNLDQSLTLSSRRMSPSDAASADLSLAGSALVLWQAPLPTGKAKETVDGFIEGGGVVLFMPPKVPGGTAYRGVRWGEWSSMRVGDDPRSPETWRSDDDLLAAGSDGTPLPVGEVELFGWCGIELVVQEEHTHQTLAAMTPLPGDASTGQALDRLLVRAATLKGGAYFLAAWPTAESTNLASQGIVWVAMVQRAIDLASLGQSPDAQRNAGPGDWLTEDWRPVGDGGATLFDRDLFAGVLSDGDGFIALNRPESEDTSAPQPTSVIRGLFGDIDVVADAVSGGSEESGLLEEIWRVFMALALVGLLAEALLCASEGDAPPFEGVDGGAKS